jgi:acetyl-CoA carboxylase biotin carboxyl carrier protein
MRRRPHQPDSSPSKTGDAVADDGSKVPSPFDVRTIKDLVALMSRHDLTEIDLREGSVRIRLRRGPRNKVTVMPAAAAAAPTPTNTPAPAAPVDEGAARPAKNLIAIKSPAVGTFYAAPNPDAEPYVRVGTKVTPTTVVCQIEAMKIFNEIQAECNGVIAEVLVDNQQPVEYGQVLFRVDPAG